MIRPALILFLFFAFAHHGFSQEREKKSEPSKRESRLRGIAVMEHGQYIDSANFYKKTDLEKSIDFIARSMEALGSGADKDELPTSLATLGESYMYHNRRDLAIANFKDALTARELNKTKLLLGKAYVLNKEFALAESTLLPLLDLKNMVPYYRVELYEALGDAAKGMSDFKKALGFYTEGLRIAQKNQISPKFIDLTSKLADTYASDTKLV